MKKFSVKDFIIYNNPCFCCGENISIRVGSISEGSESIVFLKPFTSPQFLEVNLQITYTSGLKLKIFNKTNQFQTNNVKRLKDYLQTHKLLLSSICGHHATIDSQHLEFNFDKGIVHSFGISTESFAVESKTNFYQVFSDFSINHTMVYVNRVDSPTPVGAVRLDLPCTPLGKFKDKNHFIDKIKTYITFS